MHLSSMLNSLTWISSTTEQRRVEESPVPGSSVTCLPHSTDSSPALSVSCRSCSGTISFQIRYHDLFEIMRKETRDFEKGITSNI